jgi:hypothetical protein
MAMSPRIRRELGKQRELLWHFLEGQKCFFCKDPLLSLEDQRRTAEISFGNATAPPMDLDITIHHENGNHDDNRKSNRKPAHESCHKSWEAKRVFSALRGAA